MVSLLPLPGLIQVITKRRRKPCFSNRVNISEYANTGEKSFDDITITGQVHPVANSSILSQVQVCVSIKIISAATPKDLLQNKNLCDATEY